MSIFELNKIATPIAGIIGGVKAVPHAGGWTSVGAGALGLVIGVACVFLSAGLAILSEKINESSKLENVNPVVKTIFGLLCFLPMICLPLISGYGSYWICRLLLT